ncbi:DUF397 domain-containing protein [Phytomonospora sp. NPDC050363]|uniref:DUF397 domain-containing protein n=1 Tax=Phytomonospora sp. NPDC050363 TaxID=3155642 RepID=UPI0033CFCB27
MTPLAWRKSSRSNSGTGQCVEVAASGPEVAVRDSKDKAGPALTCDRATWAGFVSGLR